MKQFIAKSISRLIKAAFLVAACVSIFITVVVVLSIIFEAMRFFAIIPVNEFLFGLHWNPESESTNYSGNFGAVSVFTGTLLITVIALLVAVPLGLFSAIYLSEYSSNRFRNFAKPALEILAGIPTVVYGYFAALTVAPIIRAAGEMLGINVASESALAAGLVMGIMIVPFVLSISDDVIRTIPSSIRDASLALGATKAETVVKVVFPAAFSGIMGAVLLATSRAIGETMIVTMAAGLYANLTFNPLHSVTTVTAQFVTLLVGDQEFDSPQTLAAFALALTLFLATLLLNIIALLIIKRSKEKYGY
jgi:phosphate transport system permease protein